ncbi:receptor-type tyrosine-protein kinase FLT3, partial [Exaiptasia diaphana]|uniref:Protein kinase domain-containing protein n=1 Tax=Exaiptasia diaphana TaxID=2652724 RepID=A0A913X3D7_EXADI
LKVTPVFDVDIIVGEKSSITISNPSVPVKQLSTLNPIEIAGIAIGVFVFVLLVVVFLLWYLRRQKRIKDGVLVGGKGAVIDLWEVPVEKIYLEEELGEGAFGKVFKGILLELPEQSAKYSIAKSIRRKSLKPLNQEDGFVVAVKMLHDMADAEQTREFLKEIQLMKDVGSHRNIVNMLGCGTLSDPMFLIVEYLPNGDLLHYLRKRRGKATKYPDSDPRGPYHSTYCQTYFNKNKPEEGLLVQASRSNRIYVHSPENAKESSPGDIQLLSVQRVETGNNDVVATGYDSEDCEKDDIDDDILTPGDLMAFAWQVSQGM